LRSGGRKLNRKVVLIVVIFLFFTGLNISPDFKFQTASARKLYVGTGQTYTSIQDAINNSTPNDEIYVYNGTYIETLNVDVKHLNIIGEDKDTTIINANFIGNALNVTNDNILIKDFTIINAGGNGIFVNDVKNLTVENCFIKNNDINGISLQNSNIVKIILCDISNNDIGVFIDDTSTENLIYFNNFYNNLINAESNNINNFWYNNNFLKGNYWGCYDEEFEGAFDNDSDGIIDTSYDIPGGSNHDLYPLANPLGLDKPVAVTNGPYEAEIDEVITFDGSGSYDLDGIVVSWVWDFGDSNFSDGMVVSYSYSESGVYDVTLKVEDSLGLSDLAVSSATININDENPDEPLKDPVSHPKIKNDNIAPIADAGGPYYEIKGVEIQFDGSDSYDVDGTTLTYKWKFGDGNTSSFEMPTHAYTKEGNYTVELRVTDEDGITDVDTTNSYISKRANNPPQIPIIKGPLYAEVNVSINFSAIAIDNDSDDQIIYVFNWGDGTNQTNSSRLNSSEVFNTKHNFKTGGVYSIDVYVIDESNTPSETQTFKILISSHTCGSLGYLIDKNGDGVYDVFYRETTDRETKTQKNNNEYYIDINGDQNWDYKYNFTTDEVLKYSSSLEQEGQEFNFDTNWIMIIIGIPIILVIIVAILIIIKISKTEKSKTTKKPKEIKKMFYSFYKKDEEINKIHEEIDKLLEKNKK